MIAGFLTKAAKPVIIVLLMICLAAFLGWLALSTVDGMVERAVAAKAAERDAICQAEIETANTKVAQTEAAQIRLVLDLEHATSAQIAALKTENEELEKQNAALPNGDACGLGRDRIRLLPR